ARGGYASHLCDLEHRPCSSKAALAEPPRQASDAVEGARRIERNLEDAKAVVGKRIAHGLDLLGRDPAQHRDQRQRLELGSEAQGAHWGLLTLWAHTRTGAPGRQSRRRTKPRLAVLARTATPSGAPGRPFPSGCCRKRRSRRCKVSPGALPGFAFAPCPRRF